MNNLKAGNLNFLNKFNCIYLYYCCCFIVVVVVVVVVVLFLFFCSIWVIHAFDLSLHWQLES